jgi:alpha-1,3-rhamnosyl/mannosyltransferase
VRVIFNVECLFDPPLTGVGQYTDHLLRGLLRHRAAPELLCFAHFRPVPPPVEIGGASVPVRRRRWQTVKHLAARIPGLLALRQAQRRRHFRRGLGEFQADLYHEPNHILLPFGGSSIVTVHDLSVLHFPDLHPRARVEYFERYFEQSVRQAFRIVTVSHFVRRDIEATMGISGERIRVTPLGVGAEFRPMQAADIAPALVQYGLEPGRYLLFVGTREPRKNLDRLIDAYLGLPQALQTRFPLVLAGPAGWRSKILEGRLDRLERHGTVRRLGYVAGVDRPALYAGARGFAYPSLYEGFGLPPLEAAACGVPVLTSRDSPMAETLEEDALLVDPEDVDAIRAGLARMAEDDDLYRHARFIGAARAARFTWDACVDRTMAVYSEILRPEKNGIPALETAAVENR